MTPRIMELNTEFNTLTSIGSLSAVPTIESLLKSDPKSTAAVANSATIAAENNKKDVPHKKSTTSKHSKPKRKENTRARRVIPDNKEALYIDGDPSQFDVVSGRGGGANHHEGNKPYWGLILEMRDGYKSSRNENHKTKMAMSVIHSILSKGGRFLQREVGTGKWFRLPEKVIMEKVKQALRDKYVPLWAREDDDAPTKSKKNKTKSTKESASVPAPLGHSYPPGPIQQQAIPGMPAPTIQGYPPVVAAGPMTLPPSAMPPLSGDALTQRNSFTTALLQGPIMTNSTMAHMSFMHSANSIPSFSSLGFDLTGQLKSITAVNDEWGQVKSLSAVSDEWAAVEALGAVAKTPAAPPTAETKQRTDWSKVANNNKGTKEEAKTDESKPETISSPKKRTDWSKVVNNEDATAKKAETVGV